MTCMALWLSWDRFMVHFQSWNKMIPSETDCWRTAREMLLVVIILVYDGWSRYPGGFSQCTNLSAQKSGNWLFLGEDAIHGGQALPYRGLIVTNYGNCNSWNLWVYHCLQAARIAPLLELPYGFQIPYFKFLWIGWYKEKQVRFSSVNVTVEYWTPTIKWNDRSVIEHIKSAMSI